MLRRRGGPRAAHAHARADQGCVHSPAHRADAPVEGRRRRRRRRRLRRQVADGAARADVRRRGGARSLPADPRHTRRAVRAHARRPARPRARRARRFRQGFQVDLKIERILRRRIRRVGESRG